MSQKTAARAAIIVFTGLVTACGGGGAGGASGTAPTPTPAPAPSPPAPPAPPAPSPPAPPSAELPTSWAQVADLYDMQPDLASCRAGTLKAGVKNDLLAQINTLRARHNLAPVSYESADDAQAQESSLIMAANEALSHQPPTGWRCSSGTGAEGAGTSNLLIGWGTGLAFASADDHLAQWVNEGGDAQLGHRRWILHPFLGKVSYGRLAAVRAGNNRIDAASLKVFSFTGGRPAPASVPAFVAVPFGDYPVRYFRIGDYLNFQIAPAATANGSDSRVGFGSARISVTSGATSLAVTDQSSDNGGYGLANNLQWRVTALQRGTTYTVRITGVTNAPLSEYSYTFRIVD